MRCRFTIRTAFAILVLLGTLLACVGNVVHNARVQRSAISDVRSVGGRVYYPYASIEPFDESLPKLVIRSVLGSEYVYSVTQINLNGTRVSDRDVQALSRLGTLERLNLSQAAISDSALTAIPRLDGLEEVNVEGTAVSDAGVVHLSQCQQLRYLWLRGTKVTDSSVQLLIQLNDLKKLDIRGTAITADGVARLLNARPGVEIYHESQPEALAMLPKAMQRPIARRPTPHARRDPASMPDTPSDSLRAAGVSQWCLVARRFPLRSGRRRACVQVVGRASRSKLCRLSWTHGNRTRTQRSGTSTNSNASSPNAQPQSSASLPHRLDRWATIQNLVN